MCCSSPATRSRASPTATCSPSARSSSETTSQHSRGGEGGEGRDRFFAMSAWKQGFGGAQEWKDLSTMDFRYRVRHAQVWHSYAITVHSAQGSEWDHVLIAQDGNRDRKWLYTAITRAKAHDLGGDGRWTKWPVRQVFDKLYQVVLEHRGCEEPEIGRHAVSSGGPGGRRPRE
ncbi:MAG: ATP-binding domain-containing protein [Gemmatimonadetes bacterium]|nr:ATP-binding domain-containing protein [Gemmatimonadota bacterium]